MALNLGNSLEQFVPCPSILPVRGAISYHHLGGQLARSPLLLSLVPVPESLLHEMEPILAANMARVRSCSHKHFFSALPHIISNSPKPRS